MPKRLIATIDDDSRQKLKAGIDLTANIVKRTLGVKGRNVAIDTDRYRMPLLTNDGVSVAFEIHAEDDFEELGCKLIKEAAAKTEDNAGDGTTTTMILMQAIVEGGMEALGGSKDPKSGNVFAKTDPLALRAEIESDVNKVIDEVATRATPAKDVKTLGDVATISCRDREIGELIAKTVHAAGDDGMVSLEDNLGGKTEVVELEGLQLRTGWAAKQFINQPSLKQVALSNVGVLVTNAALTSAEEYTRLGEQAILAEHKVLVVFTQDIGAEFMVWAYNYWNRQDIPVKILPVRFNTASDIADGMLRDIAAVTGADFIDTMNGDSINTITKQSFGRAKKVIQTKLFTTVLPSNKDLIADRIAELKVEVKDSTEFAAENIKERIARLSGGCFTVRVGGMTETELRERKTRVQDALNSAQAAYQHGVVKGGGLTLLETGHHANDLVEKACRMPFEQLAENSGIDEVGWASNVEADKTILDPALVVMESLRNAAVQAIQVLLCETLIVDPAVNE